MSDTFLNFLDRIDGGGAGQAGQEFQGGGILSSLGNMFFKPRGYYDRQKELRREQLAQEAMASTFSPRPASSSSPADTQTPYSYIPEMPVEGAMPPARVPVQPEYIPEMPVEGVVPPAFLSSEYNQNAFDGLNIPQSYEDPTSQFGYQYPTPTAIPDAFDPTEESMQVNSLPLDPINSYGEYNAPPSILAGESFQQYLARIGYNPEIPVVKGSGVIAELPNAPRELPFPYYNREIHRPYLEELQDLYDQKTGLL